MNNKSKKALELFNNGSNCSQSVFSVFAEEHGISHETSSRIACGLGAGMGRLQNTCGAVTGAYLSLGLYFDKDTTYEKVKEFDKKFSDDNEHTICSFLLKCDLNTPEGKKHFENNKLREVICNKCVESAVELVENMI